MPPAVLTRLNTTIFWGFQKAAVGGKARPGNSVELLFGKGGVLPRSIWSSAEGFQFSSNRIHQRKTMAASGSKTVPGDIYMDSLVSSCGNAIDFSKPNGVFFEDRTRRGCQKSSMSIQRREHSKTRLVCRYSIYDTVWRNCKEKDLEASPWACYSTEAASNVSVQGNSNDDLLTKPKSSDDQEVPLERVLKLVSGSCCLPHPDKEEKGGEDAHFICDEEQVIGVADGVGGWADVGVDAGLYSRELMSNSVNAIKEEPKGTIDPLRVLEKAHGKTKMQGSSTACIIALTEKGIHAINLGDSGFIVIRDGSTVFNSPVQQHGFNFTYQLENGKNGDLPSSGQVFTIPAATGDVIVAGTDGMFDNLYIKEITAIVVESRRAKLGPQATAEKIAALARQRAMDRKRQTPFSAAAQEAGFRYHGGKLDDITVVVSYIISPSDS